MEWRGFCRRHATWQPSSAMYTRTRRYTVGLAEGIEKEGVVFKLETAVKQLKHHGRDLTGPRGFGYGVDLVLESGETESFDGIVVCAGVSSRALARQLGDRVNIYPVKGYSITVNLKDEASQMVRRHAAPRPARDALIDARCVDEALALDRCP